jgi:hypothetical protein
MSTPFTRATTWSEAEAAGVDEDDDDSCEHPDATGRASARTANVANVTMRERRAGPVGEFREVIQAVLGMGRLSANDNRAGSPSRADHLNADFVENKRPNIAD